MTTENDRIAREGLAYIFLLALACLAAVWLYWPLALVFAFLLAFTIYFFRNPKRVTPSGEDLLICPADGTVIAVDELDEKDFLKKKMQHIAVFMSPFNVHVNRAPASGCVIGAVYHQGQYKAAFDKRAGELNERSVLHLKTTTGAEIVFMQIAGWFARRIVTYAKSGDQLTSGKIFGLIKFGSRMEIFFPENFATQVKVGDKVSAGETILAKKI